MTTVLTEEDMTTYWGIEVQKAVLPSLNKGTLKALRMISKKGYCVVERDDGPEGYEMFEQLENVLNAVGIQTIVSESGYVMYCISDEPSDRVSLP